MPYPEGRRGPESLARILRDLRDHPLRLKEVLWPDVIFYRQQRLIIESVWDNDETYVPAGNMLGKDYVGGYVALAFFLTRHPCRVVTTSAKDDHLRVLWGEINRYVQSCKYPLDFKSGGPLRINHQDIRKVFTRGSRAGTVCPISYLTGLVAGADSIAAMQGHHVAKTGDGVPRTLFVSDESSSVRDEYMKMASTWMNRALVIGNTWPCQNFFYRGVKAGNLKAPEPHPVTGRERYYRRVLRIRADESPNVRLVIAQMKAGLRKPDPEMIRTPDRPWGLWTPHEFHHLNVLWQRKKDNEERRRGDGSGIIETEGGTDSPLEIDRISGPSLPSMALPGVKDYDEYKKNRLTWDRIHQTVSLDAEFYEGAEVRLFPKEWLDFSESVAESLAGRVRKAKAIGIDPAEGGDSTAFAVVDELGLIELVSLKTPDTSVIANFAAGLMQKHNVPDDKVCFDRGGGGKQIADEMRRRGFVGVRTVAFGESLTPDPKRAMTIFEEKVEAREERTTYRNRRAQMYGLLRNLINPSPGTDNRAPDRKSGRPVGFGLPKQYTAIREQLTPIPLWYDEEGRLELPPKNRRGERGIEGEVPGRKKGDQRPTLVELIGYSPDECDALVVGVFTMLTKQVRRKAGAVG